MEQTGLENIWLKKIGVEIIESNGNRNNWLGKKINIFFLYLKDSILLNIG